MNNFINEFDTNIYPKESEAFSVAPPRDGHNARPAEAHPEPAVLGVQG